MFFSVMSLGYARSSDQDAAVLDQAVSGLARSLQPNSRVVDRLWKMLSAPANAVLAITSYVISTVLFPFRQTSSAVGRALDAARMAILESYRASISWIACNADAIATYFGRNGKAVESSLRAAASWISRNLEAIVSFFAHYGGAVSNAVRGVAAFLFNAPGAGKAWVSRVVETIASFFEMFGDTFDGFLQGILAWLARFEDTMSRRGCSLMANPGVSSAVENISLLFRSCQQVITSFAVWFTAANLNKTDKGT